jgi:hypothetical protein
VSVTGTFDVAVIIPARPSPSLGGDASATIAWTNIAAPDTDDPGNVEVSAAIGSLLQRRADAVPGRCAGFIDRLDTLKTTIDTVSAPRCRPPMG